LGSPFLADGFDSPEERRAAIAYETELYYEHKWGMELPPDAEPPEQMPDCLYWLHWVEAHGPVRAGGSLDQPWHFMCDLDAARLGRTRAKELRAANARMKREYQSRYGQQE